MGNTPKDVPGRRRGLFNGLDTREEPPPSLEQRVGFGVRRGDRVLWEGVVFCGGFVCSVVMVFSGDRCCAWREPRRVDCERAWPLAGRGFAQVQTCIR